MRKLEQGPSTHESRTSPEGDLKKLIEERGINESLRGIIEAHNVFLRAIGHPDEWTLYRYNDYNPKERTIARIIRRSSLHRARYNGPFVTQEVSLLFGLDGKMKVTGAEVEYSNDIPDMKSKSLHQKELQEWFREGVVISMGDPNIRRDFNAE